MLPKTCDWRRDGGAVNREAFIGLDRVERLGERRNAMRDDDDVRMLEVAGGITVRPRPEQVHIG